MSQHHDGGCACGAVRYRVQGTPAFAAVCHCRFCQRRSAGAFAVLATFREEEFQLTQGEVVQCEHRSDESGRWLRMNFCPRCGTTVSHTAEIRPGMRSVAVGTLDEQDWFAIDRHIWVRSKQPWVVVPPDVPKFERGYVPPATAAT